MQKLLFLFCLFGLLSGNVRGQERALHCGSDLLDQHYRATDPDYAHRRADIESDRVLYTHLEKSASAIKIPVVVHVIYRTAAQNITDEQIYSQLDVINKDFNKMNWDTVKVPSVWKNLIADVGIEFVLANRDPNGDPTTGITRKSTTVKDLANINGDAHAFNSKGGQDIWDRNQYLNIWVCEISGGVYGFGTFPGAPAGSDGVVIDFIAFGTEGTAVSPTNKGRTASHEIAHWLDILHLWGYTNCGDDLVSDTPEHLEGNFNCPSWPHNTACNATANGEMFMNFMDYTDDSCLNFFTKGQKTRMMSTINGSRSSLLSSNGYNGLEAFDEKPFKLYPLPANNYINIQSNSSEPITRIEILNVSGKLISYAVFNNYEEIQRFRVSELDNGIYFIKLYSGNGVYIEKVLISHH